MQERIEIFRKLEDSEEFRTLKGTLRYARKKEERFLLIDAVLKTGRSRVDLSRFFLRCFTDPGMMMTRYGLGAVRRIFSPARSEETRQEVRDRCRFRL